MSQVTQVIETLYGRLDVPIWPSDLIVRSLIGLGEWCASEAMLASTLLRADDVLWDAGAFLGTFSLGVARINPPKSVVAIEANPDLKKSLHANLSLLPCQASVFMGGVGPSLGWLTPHFEDDSNHGATSYTFKKSRPKKYCAIRSKSLPALRAIYGRYDFLKLDLEGMELDVLRSDLAYLKEHRPTIWIECNETLASLTLFSEVKKIGYDITYVAFPAFRVKNYRGADELIYPMAYEAALVAAPIDRLNVLEDAAFSAVPGEDILCIRVNTLDDLRNALFNTPRWASYEWTQLSRPELIARLGHAQLGKTVDDFIGV